MVSCLKRELAVQWLSIQQSWWLIVLIVRVVEQLRLELCQCVFLLLKNNKWLNVTCALC